MFSFVFRKFHLFVLVSFTSSPRSFVSAITVVLNISNLSYYNLTSVCLSVRPSTPPFVNLSGPESDRVVLLGNLMPALMLPCSWSLTTYCKLKIKEKYLHLKNK